MKRPKELTDERFLRLPQYARRHIENLERTIKEMKEEGQAIVNGETNISWRTPLGGDEIYLPEHSIIKFTNNFGSPLNAYRSSERCFGKTDKQLTVMSKYGRIYTRPESGNMVTIIPED